MKEALFGGSESDEVEADISSLLLESLVEREDSDRRELLKSITKYLL